MSNLSTQKKRLETLQDLDQSLRALGSQLVVLRGSPESVFPILFESWSPSSVVYEIDTEPYAIQRDKKLGDLAKKAGVEFVGVHGHTIYSPQSIIQANKGKPPLTYNAFLKIAAQFPVPEPLDAPKSLPSLGDLTLKVKKIEVPKVKDTPARDPIDIEQRQKCFEFLNGPDGSFSIPTLQELGQTPLSASEQSPHRGGEKKALEVLEKYFEDKVRVAKFEKPNTSPAAFKPASTTVLSPHLKFGSLSCRLFYKKLQDVYKSYKNHSQPPVSLVGQLLWRDFFYTASFGIKNFDKMKGNSACLQIKWRLQEKEGKADKEAEEHLKAWAEGRTGYPWIDAIMTQLRKEGWIHHLARHSVACFLTRGDLYISWERGVEVFDELLLDADYALNNGNWLWLSQYFRVYSPIAFGKKYDKEGKFIRQYVPALSKMPTQYIFEPWTAPLSVQKQAGCIIGQDYPHPIVQHDVVSKENMAKMKAAYSAGKKGDSKLPVTLLELVEDDLKEEEGDVNDEPLSPSLSHSKKRAVSPEVKVESEKRAKK